MGFPDPVKESPDEGSRRSAFSRDLKIHRYLVALPGLVFLIYIAISAQLKIPVWRSVLFYYDIDIA